MSNLKREPPIPVQSLDELFAIAHAMEQEAALRYTELAHRMRVGGKFSLAELFDDLAAEERSHVESVSHWSKRERGREPDPALVRWKIPETFDDEGASATDPRLISAYRSLSMAVRNEERAFSFWSYVVAHAQNSDVRRAAEAMASEELEHVAKLRRERRRAYHAERSVTSGKSVANDDLSVLELRLAERLDAFATDLDQDNAARVHGLANETRAIADELIRKPLTMPRRAASEPIPEEAVALSEFLVDRYLEAAEHVADEQSMIRAQTLARRAIDRLSSLRADLPELHGLRDVLSVTKSES